MVKVDVRRGLARIAMGAAALALVLPGAAEAGSTGVLVRKDVKHLTTAERRDFVDALLALKSVPSPYDRALSYYDQFVAWHLELSRCNPADPLMREVQTGHAGPMFLPWHREFVRLLERALGDVSGRRIAMPYWDWTDAGSTQAVFSDGFMGGDGDPAEGYAVTDGPFRKGRWKLNVDPIGLQWSSSAAPYITRRFGSFPGVELPDRDDIGVASAAPLYDAPPFGVESDPAVSFRNALEGFRPPLAATIACGPDGVILETQRPPIELHNAVHIWVGGRLFPEQGGAGFVGTMFNVTSSPNDPVFFLHHAMVDRIWAKWQERHGVSTYLPQSGFPGNNAGDVMRPFDKAGIRVTPEDVADIRALGYAYDSQQSGLLGQMHSRARPAMLQPAIRFRCTVPRVAAS